MASLVEMKEGVEPLINNQNHVTSSASIPAVRTPSGDELLPSERDTAVAAVARLDSDPYRVDEHRLDSAPPQRKRARSVAVICHFEGLGRSVRNDADETAESTPVLKLHFTGRGREQSVITAALDVHTRLETRSTLADENGPGSYYLTVPDLGPESLRLGITAVAARALSFFVCHDAPYVSIASTRTL
jgi:hypothetical protein